MPDIIGQKGILELFKTYKRLDNAPHFIILEGPKGQGKYTLAKHFAKMFGFSIYEPEELKVDNIRAMVEDGLTVSHGRLYIIRNAEELTTQAQNALLKFIEEPAAQVYIIMTTTEVERLLSTIKSRAKLIKMEPYTIGELAVFDGGLLMNICQNPGEIKELEKIDYQALYDFCQKVRDNIGRASAANALNICKSVDKDGEYTAEQFLLMLEYAFTNHLDKIYQSDDLMVDPKYQDDYHKAAARNFKVIQIINRTRALLARKGVMRHAAMDICILDIREAVREVQS